MRKNIPRLVGYDEIMEIYGLPSSVVSYRIEKNDLISGRIGRRVYFILDDNLNRIMSVPVNGNIQKGRLLAKARRSSTSDSFEEASIFPVERTHVDMELIEMLS